MLGEYLYLPFIFLHHDSACDKKLTTVPVPIIAAGANQKRKLTTNNMFQSKISKELYGKMILNINVLHGPPY